MPIVCGTDFSECSRSAISAATALATKLGATELWLANVLDPATKLLDLAAQGVVRSGAMKLLEEQATRAQQCTASAVRHVLLTGATSESLLAFANDKKASLLIVASRGHSASPLYRLGGTSERLAQSTHLPVLVVRDGECFDAWAKSTRPLRVLLAVDWSRSCDAAIRWVKALRDPGACDVVVGYVYYSDLPGEGAVRYGLPRRHSITERDPEVESLIARDLAARVGHLGGRGEVVFRPQHGMGRLGDSLLDLADAERVDLIVSGTHHRRGLARLGSVSSVTLHYGRASVAVVPVPEDEILAPDEVPSIRRVLVATDLSAFSNFAVPFGYTLVSPNGGEVCLVHVQPEVGDSASDADLAARLRALAPIRGIPANAATRCEVVHDANVPRAICKAAERLGADAVCLASHGRTAAAQAVLGSVAEAVLRESRLPVFIVRPRRP